MTSVMTTVIILALALRAIAIAELPASPRGKTMAFDKVFDIDYSTDQNGGCKSYKDKIETAYIETMAMCEAAVDSMNWLACLQEPVTKDSGEDYNELLRIKQLYQKVFYLDPQHMDGIGLNIETMEVLSR